MLKRCYISGPISNTSDYHERFADAEIEVTALGMIPINPVTLPHDHDKEYNSYLKADVIAMMECDVIYLLKNWEKSNGACIEAQLAALFGYKIIYQANFSGILIRPYP